MKKSVCLLLIFIMVFSCATFASDGIYEYSSHEYNIEEPYTYPIVPGSSEWANFDTVYEMIEVCQIPEDILKNMSTEALVKTVLNYPLLMDLMAGNTPREGFAVMMSNFNGLQELSTRSDAGDYLDTEYLDFSRNYSQTKSSYSELEMKEHLTGILLSQPELNKNLIH